jgi:hypothetical protein
MDVNHVERSCRVLTVHVLGLLAHRLHQTIPGRCELERDLLVKREGDLCRLLLTSSQESCASDLSDSACPERRGIFFHDEHEGM